MVTALCWKCQHHFTGFGVFEPAKARPERSTWWNVSADGKIIRIPVKAMLAIKISIVPAAGIQRARQRPGGRARWIRTTAGIFRCWVLTRCP